MMLRRTRRCRGLRGVGPVLSRHFRTGACTAVRISTLPLRVRTALLRPTNARVARFTAAT